MIEQPSRGCLTGLFLLAALLLAAIIVLIGVLLHFGWELANRWI